MKSLWVIGAISIASPASADELSDATLGSDFLERCLAAADGEFERALSPTLDPEERPQILSTLSQDVLTCTSVASQACIGSAQAAACFASLVATLDASRLALLGELAPTIDASDPFQRRLYENAVARAVAVEPFDPCPDDIAQYPEGCNVLAQAMAFQDARAARRMLVLYSTEDR